MLLLADPKGEVDASYFIIELFLLSLLKVSFFLTDTYFYNSIFLFVSEGDLFYTYWVLLLLLYIVFPAPLFTFTRYLKVSSSFLLDVLESTESLRGIKVCPVFLYSSWLYNSCLILWIFNSGGELVPFILLNFYKSLVGFLILLLNILLLLLILF